MRGFFFWSGIVAWALVGLGLLYPVVLAVLRAWSFLQWNRIIRRLGGAREADALEVFASFWHLVWRFLTAKFLPSAYFVGLAEWRDIGNWTIPELDLKGRWAERREETPLGI